MSRVFTKICTSELARLAKRQSDFTDRQVKIIGISPDPVTQQKAWLEEIRHAVGDKIDFPMIGDPSCSIMKLYNMLQDTDYSHGSETVIAEGQITRSVFLISPDKTIKLMLAYPTETYRNLEEILRVIDSVRLAAIYSAGRLSADERTNDLASPTTPSASGHWRNLKAFLARTLRGPLASVSSDGPV